MVPGGGPAPIPTLSEWAMIFLGLLLAALAFRHLRRQSSSHV
ncbi:MAG TPA: IPTL-CTERM sorting domain-containing protein [Candidatus Methylomirabilis sp.]|nr:IPTL-CTERM sorting domain-containing protein [Candidatus Methylomirabilis sp.]